MVTSEPLAFLPFESICLEDLLSRLLDSHRAPPTGTLSGIDLYPEN
ncbi:hypothetical protein QA596_12555 [Balneolales bacterium ANBcel1]|nr:hypothetical protein [Balneolales bacterium ANBcel1]